MALECFRLSLAGFGGRVIGSPCLSRNSLKMSRKEANVSGGEISTLGKGGQEGERRNVRG